MSSEHIPVHTTPSESESIKVSRTHNEAADSDAGRVADIGQAEHMAHLEDRIRQHNKRLGEQALEHASKGMTYYDNLAKVLEKNKRINEELMPGDVEREGEEYRELMDIVNEIRSRAEGASTPDELNAKEKMEEAIQRALRTGGVIGGPNTLLLNKYNFERLPEIREASGYANRAGGAHRKVS